MCTFLFFKHLSYSAELYGNCLPFPHTRVMSLHVTGSWQIIMWIPFFFPFRILALQENFLLQFKMDVSSNTSLDGFITFMFLYIFEKERRKKEKIWGEKKVMPLTHLETDRAHCWDQGVKGHWLKVYKNCLRPERTVQLKFHTAGLTHCFLRTQACSAEERKRDFEKIFAHYDVVSAPLYCAGYL